MKGNTTLQKLSIEMGISYAQVIDHLPAHIIDKSFLVFASFNIHKEKVLPACFKNILTGELDNFEIFLADFRSDYSVDDKAFGYKQTIAILRSADFSLPRFYLTPKKTERFTVRLEHIGQDFFLPRIRGYKKISFSNYPQLKSKYILKVQGAHSSQRLLSMSFMLYMKDHSGWFIEGYADSLLLYRRGKTINPPEIRDYVVDILKIGRLLVVNS